MHIDIIDPGAPVFPRLTAISTQQVPAMFEQNPNQILLIGMDEDLAHMGKLDSAQARRHVPFLFYSVAKVEHAVERLPTLTTVFAAEKADRADAHVNNALVMRINRECAHIAIHNLGPSLSCVFGAIAAIECDCGKNDLGLNRAAGQMLKCFSLEEFVDGLH